MGAINPRAAQILRTARQESGLSQQALARRSGISERTIRGLEAAAVAAPRRATVDALLRHFAISARHRSMLLELCGPAQAAPIGLAQVIGREPPDSDLVRRHRDQARRVREHWRTLSATIDAQRKLAEERISRSCAMQIGGVDRFVSAIGIDPSVVDGRRVEITGVNCRVGRLVLSTPEMLLIELLFDQEFAAGQACTFGYNIDYRGAYRRSAGLTRFTTEVVQVVQLPGVALSVQVNFETAQLPARLWRIANVLPIGVPAAVTAMAINRFEVADVTIGDPAPGGYGIRWLW